MIRVDFHHVSNYVHTDEGLLINFSFFNFSDECFTSYYDNKKKRINLPVYQSESRYCQRLLNSNLTNQQICFEDRTGKIFKGNSGGPVFCSKNKKWTLRGSISYGPSRKLSDTLTYFVSTD